MRGKGRAGHSVGQEIRTNGSVPAPPHLGHQDIAGATTALGRPDAPPSRLACPLACLSTGQLAHQSVFSLASLFVSLSSRRLLCLLPVQLVRLSTCVIFPSTSLSVRKPFFLLASLSTSLPDCLSIFSSANLSVHPSVLLLVSLFACQPHCTFVFHLAKLSVVLSSSPSPCPLVCLPPVALSISLFTHLRGLVWEADHLHTP